MESLNRLQTTTIHQNQVPDPQKLTAIHICFMVMRFEIKDSSVEKKMWNERDELITVLDWRGITIQDK